MREHWAETWPATANVKPDWPNLPGYEIIEELGRGGMGVVYKARQVSLQRIVALKLIRDTALAGPQEIARFRIEIEAAARMQHPNIVEIYDAGEYEGRPYLAMEFVGGARLDQQASGQPQPAWQTAEFVRTLALAIEHAHSRNVVHRDLKPANVLLSNLPGQVSATRADVQSSNNRWAVTIPKITDFGLAKRLDSESTAFTLDGAILGTASYMAPEQAAGRSREIGPAVDVYALGAILYELLTGQPPFRADTWSQTVQLVLHDDPLPPTRLQPQVPRDLETICLKCLEKEPGRRYGSAMQLASDLGRYLDGESVVAVPMGQRERLARQAARDGYDLIEEIGSGPRSIVYHALFGPAQRSVAIKVFANGICSREDWDERIRRIHELWAVVAHPQCVPVQQAGWWDGAPYLVLEYAPHGSLAARLIDDRYPFRESLRLVGQLAEIVGYLHRQGVVHSNLKPSNVLLAADGIPRLTDFYVTGGWFQTVPPIEESESAGLHYVAPELIEYPPAEPRPNTDIYGLGLVLYELLTGQPPFAGESAQATRERVCSEDPAPPSNFNPAVTPQLDAVCLRCLRKNPWRRYARAHDLMKRLQSFEDHPEG
jgi:serine/threonine protein kinase